MRLQTAHYLLFASSFCFSLCLTTMVLAAEEEPQFQKPDGFRAQAARRRANLTAEQRQRIMRQFDANNNGRLEPAELQAARRAFAQRNKNSADNGNLQGKNAKNANGNRNATPVAKNKPGPAGTQDRRFGLSPQQRAALVRRFDANDNGRLDPPEIAKARATLRRFGANGGGATNKRPQARTGRFGGPNKGPSTDNPRRANSEIIRRFDTNKNGRLDPDEVRRLRAMAANRQNSQGAVNRAQPRANRVDQTDLLKRFDADGDGKLNAGERKAAFESLNKKEK